jgi:radical SAM superfamily enzyme YgiQ (UPF0313 family)
MRQLDVVFVQPGSSNIIYQELANQMTAIETPTWCLLLAQACRAKGFGVAILDCDAERLEPEVAAQRLKEMNPRLVVLSPMGQNPNSGTTKMYGAIEITRKLKQITDVPVCFIGSHVFALPIQTLNSHPEIDFVCYNEGVYSLQNLLRTDLKDVKDVKGIGRRDSGIAVLNEPEKVVPTALMDQDMPGYAWDLLPYRNKPFDLYRASNWHANYKESLRNPHAAVYTSLGCFKSCSFCIINSINRETTNENYAADQSNKMRFWSTKHMADIFQELVEKYDVKTIKISDEMHLFNRKYYEPLHQELINRGLGKELLMWSYARVDTINPRNLDNVRKAGIQWLAIGIESSNQKVRSEVDKGKFEEVDIRSIISQVSNSGISTISNYIFGLPEDTLSTMNETLDFAMELNTETANFYPCFALPGSPLYLKAVRDGLALPQSYDSWSFHSYECLPLPTNHLTAKEVLNFRDKAWRMYFKRPEYLSLVERKFGSEARVGVEDMLKIKLKRKILGD